MQLPHPNTKNDFPYIQIGKINHIEIIPDDEDWEENPLVRFFDNGVIIQATKVDTQYFTDPPTYFRSLKTDTAQFAEFRSYCGIGRYSSWPLQWEEDDISKALTEEAEQRWFGFEGISQLDRPDEPVFPLEVIPDRDYCRRYLQHCCVKDLATRALFCRTPRDEFIWSQEERIWNHEIPLSLFLGYDYAYSGDDFYSAIPLELLLVPAEDYADVPEYRSLLECKVMLNQYKIFQTQQDVLAFVEKRNTLIKLDMQWNTDHGGSHDINPFHLVESHGDFVIFHLSQVIGDL